MRVARSIGLFAAAGLLFGQLPSGAAEPAPDNRALLAKKLREPFTNERAFDGVPLEAALEVIGLKTGITFLIDTAAFKAEDPKVDTAQTSVWLPVLRNVSLVTALRMLLDDQGMSYLVMPDHIRVTTRRAAARYAGLSLPEPPKPTAKSDEKGEKAGEPAEHIPWLELAHLDVDQRPLKDVVKDLVAQTGANVVLAPQVGDSSETRITAQMYNVTVENAVEVLAEMADL
ncbi:MAG TPA: hypothetical protein VIL46_04665, partial [Gemmataceae bacterium]